MLLKEIEHFLEEDLGHEDYEEIVPYTECTAEITVKEPGILAGLEEVKQIFDYAGLYYATNFTDGDRMEAEDRILSVHGPGATILKTERLVLNFLGRMSGIATLTKMLVTEARKVNAQLKIAGTRKTTPGFRKYEKKAITIGGGDPHRFRLYEAVIIKDNYIQLMGLEQAIRKAKERVSFTRKIEVEVESIEDALRAADLKVEIIMLDNMPPARVRECVQLLAARGLRDGVILEASGGVNQSNIHDYAATGVDVISLGMLTHSARWLGFSLQVVG
jgi:nicotinate-nucleotide pyrophosphorylase (carboxylating)